MLLVDHTSSRSLQANLVVLTTEGTHNRPILCTVVSLGNRVTLATGRDATLHVAL
jgi:hypothetical protein